MMDNKEFMTVIWLEDLQQEIEELKRKAKQRMDETDERGEFFRQSGRHAAYKKVSQIIDDRMEEIESGDFSDGSGSVQDKSDVHANSFPVDVTGLDITETDGQG